MDSLIIGISRPGTPHNHVLNPGTSYIARYGSYPEVTFSIDCGQDQFFEKVKQLRYNDANPASSAEAIAFFETLTTRILQDLKYLTINETDLSPLHIRLVTTPMELAQIPFEFAFIPTGNTAGKAATLLLLNSRKPVILTREVPQESDARYIWPHTPRLLFAWAEPLSKERGDGSSVPHSDHYASLLDALKPLVKPKKEEAYPEPDTAPFLTVLPNASLSNLSKEITNGIKEGKPYTHIHILAHGGYKAGAAGYEFRLLLCKNGTTNQAEKVDGKKLVKALISDNKSPMPTVVSLSACDSGNLGNTILSSGSLVHQLHQAGIPCVFASQFPLTKAGSVLLTRKLYQQLINACDPREALYEARMAVKAPYNHDWASLVAYARFPEDINEQLESTQLKMLFGAMKTTNAWVDHLFKYWEEIPLDKKPEALNNIENRMEESIADLCRHLDKSNRKLSKLLTPALRAEHLGLLGSAYKRKAEYMYRLIELHPEKKEELTRKSLELLSEAKAYYAFGFAADRTNHWTALQYLSLKAIAEGNLGQESETWTVIKFFAQDDGEKAATEENRLWAWGTLAELYLLKPLLAPPDHLAAEIVTAGTKAKEYVTMIAASDTKFNYVKESTARQLERYINWWPSVYKESYPEELTAMATDIRSILPSLAELLPH